MVFGGSVRSLTIQKYVGSTSGLLLVPRTQLWPEWMVSFAFWIEMRCRFVSAAVAFVAALLCFADELLACVHCFMT